MWGPPRGDWLRGVSDLSEIDLQEYQTPGRLNHQGIRPWGIKFKKNYFKWPLGKFCMRPARLSALPSSELKQFLSLLCTTVLYSIYYLFFQLFGSVVMFYYGDPCQPCSFFCNIFIFDKSLVLVVLYYLVSCPPQPCCPLPCPARGPALPPVRPILPFSPPPRAFCCHCYSGLPC